jgi:hypothetical protein
MATRVVKLRDTAEPIPEPDQANSQRKRAELGRYLLQVDRQTKGSYETAELAQAAGLTIKTGHPVVQVSVYDSVECLNTLVELPAAAPVT